MSTERGSDSESSEVWALAVGIEGLVNLLAAGITVDFPVLRPHVMAGDVVEWLEQSFPEHAPFSSLPPLARRRIVSALQEDAEGDLDGTKFLGSTLVSNGILVLVAYLAHGVRRREDATR